MSILPRALNTIPFPNVAFSVVHCLLAAALALYHVPWHNQNLSAFKISLLSTIKNAVLWKVFSLRAAVNNVKEATSKSKPLE